MIDLAEMDLRQYCALNRARFYVDPEEDAQWFFGNDEVERAVLVRMESDLDVRGVPKCGVVGRFGIGKTHALHHIRWFVDANPNRFPLHPILMDVVWDEGNKELNTWRGVHVRMLDALGEAYLREIVRALDAREDESHKDLSEALYETFRFGDENLRRSLAIVLADYFKREARSTAAAWQWLKADKVGKLEALGVNKSISDAGDMIFLVLNLGCLARAATGQGLLFLMDEAQSLGNVRKADAEVHRAFLKLAEPDNRDIGFVIAVFGGGAAQIPKVITTPADVLSRLGVTNATIDSAFIELQRVLRSKADIRSFVDEVLEHLVDPTAATKLVAEFGIDLNKPAHLPFTEAAIDRIVEILFNREENRNPRMVIDALAKCCSSAYRASRASGHYQLVTGDTANEVLRDL